MWLSIKSPLWLDDIFLPHQVEDTSSCWGKYWVSGPDISPEGKPHLLSLSGRLPVLLRPVAALGSQTRGSLESMLTLLSLPQPLSSAALGPIFFRARAETR